jgi:hypothetical protein
MHKPIPTKASIMRISHPSQPNGPAIHRHRLARKVSGGIRSFLRRVLAMGQARGQTFARIWLAGFRSPYRFFQAGNFNQIGEQNADATSWSSVFSPKTASNHMGLADRRSARWRHRFAHFAPSDFVIKVVSLCRTARAVDPAAESDAIDDIALIDQNCRAAMRHIGGTVPESCASLKNHIAGIQEYRGCSRSSLSLTESGQHPPDREMAPDLPQKKGIYRACPALGIVDEYGIGLSPKVRKRSKTGTARIDNIGLRSVRHRKQLRLHPLTVANLLVATNITTIGLCPACCRRRSNMTRLPGRGANRR